MGDKVGMAVIAGMSAGIAFVILFASFGGQLASNQSVYRGLYMAEADGSKIAITPLKVEEESCSDCIALKSWDAESYVRETGKSAVKAEFLIKSVTLQRGSYADVPLLIKHMGGDNSERYVSVRVMPPIGYTLYPKSVAEATTEEERFEAAKAGTMLNGGIDMAQFVVASDPVNIQVGSQQIVHVRFIVPDNIPVEANGTYVPILLEVTTQSAEGQDSVYNENTGIELIIVH
jgi:hypothetical protein